MSRHRSWKGASPESSAEARQHLLAAAQACIERDGFSKVTLSDVAAAAGVTRPTVYRYFGSAEELFNAAAVTASGGFLERMRARTARLEDPVDRVVETLVILISEIPEDPYLAELFRMREAVSVRAESQNASVANELRLPDVTVTCKVASTSELRAFRKACTRARQVSSDQPASTASSASSPTTGRPDTPAATSTAEAATLAPRDAGARKGPTCTNCAKPRGRVYTSRYTDRSSERSTSPRKTFAFASSKRHQRSP